MADDLVLAEALGYARMGVAVLPTAPDKRPLTEHGCKDATTRLAVIKGWFARWPHAGVGIATGQAGGTMRRIVIDVDPRNGGDETLHTLEQEYGPLPDTRRALTGAHNGHGRGQHFYFRAPFGRVISSGVLAAGIDVKGEGGYVVAPPSMHASGVRYEWDAGGSTVSAELPAWIAERLAAPAGEIRQTGGIVGSLAHRFEALGMLGRRLDVERYIVTCPQEHLHSAGRKGDTSTVVFVPSPGRTRGWFFCAHSHCRNLCRNDQDLWDALGVTAEQMRTGASSAPVAVAVAAGFVAFDEVVAQPLDWLWPGWLERGKVTLIQGKQRRGKTVAMLDIIARHSRGDPMPGQNTGARPGRALVVSEDPVAHVTVPRLRVAGAAPGSVLVWDRAASGRFVLPSMLPELTELVRSSGATLVLFDPIRDLFAAELDPLRDQDCAIIMGELAVLGERTGVTIIAINHETKAIGGRADVRGGGAARLLSAARAQLAVMEDPDGGKADRILACINQQSALPPEPIRFRLEGRALSIGGGPAVDYPVAIWGNTVVGLGADELLVANDAPRIGGERVTQATVADVALSILVEHGRPERLWTGQDAGWIEVQHSMPSGGRDGFYAILDVPRRTLMRWGGESACGVRSARVEPGGAYRKYPAIEAPASGPPREPGQDDPDAYWRR